mgnify:CR=1 FL=1
MSNDPLAEPYQVALATDLAGAAVAMWLCAAEHLRILCVGPTVATMCACCRMGLLFGSSAPVT